MSTQFPSLTHQRCQLATSTHDQSTSQRDSGSPRASGRRPRNADASAADMATSGSFVAPDQGPQKGELALLEDRDFAADGKVMMLVLVLLFASLFIFLMVLLCMKHRRIHTHAHGLHRHNKPAEHYLGLHPPIHLPTANQVKGYSAGSGENLHNMNARQTV